MPYRQQVIDKGLEAGDSAHAVRTFVEEDVAAFGRLTGDRNPYHFDPAFAAASRFGRPIAHGLLVASMLTEIGGQWAWLATGMNFRFLAPVYVGDTVALEVRVLSRDEKNFTSAEACWTKQDGTKVIEGSLFGYPPTADQRRILSNSRDDSGHRKDEI